MSNHLSLLIMISESVPLSQIFFEISYKNVGKYFPLPIVKYKHHMDVILLKSFLNAEILHGMLY